MNDALNTIRVLDFTQGGAGPYCAQLLGDFGAAVIKVEPPRGDWAREMGSIVDPATGLTSTFASLNRNKSSLCLDLKNPEAVEIAKALADKADVVIEAFRPGIMKKLGLDQATLSRTHPALVYCSITGYGPDGPLSGAPAADSVMQAFGGFMSIVGEADGPPMRAATLVADMLSGMNAFSGILMALMRKANTGRGGHVQISLLHSIAAFQGPGIMEYAVTGQVPERVGNRHPTVAASGIFKARDGYIATSALQHNWLKFCQALGLEAFGTDPRFHDAAARRANRTALWEAMQTAIEKYSVAEMLERISAVGIMCSPVHDYRGLLAHPQVVHNGIVKVIDPGDGRRPLPVVDSPIDLGPDAQPHRPPPTVGQHSRELLRKEMGFSEARIASLVKSGAVFAADAPAPGTSHGEA